MQRPQYFGRGCTLVVVGLAALLNAIHVQSNEAWIIAIMLNIGVLYPGFTMIGLAVWPNANRRPDGS
jgi:hypothetical protein